MDGTVVEQIVGLTAKPFELAGLVVRPNTWTAEDPAALVEAGPQAKTLEVSTLGAVRDYLTANRDALPLDRVVVHIVSPSRVDVLGPLDLRTRVREVYVQAKALDMTDGYLGKFTSLEDFLIGLQIRFVDADDRARVLGLLSNVKHETVKTALDDGVTQVVQARAGVALVSEFAVPNPVKLAAYRAFRDIMQPSTSYVLRLNSGKAGGLPEAGLFEADGGTWRVAAIQRLHDWLIEAVPTVSVLA